MTDSSDGPSTEDLLQRCVEKGLVESVSEEGDRLVIVREGTRFRLRLHQVHRFLESLLDPLKRSGQG